MMQARHTAILLLAHGSPDSAADVPDFLRNVTGGRPLPEALVAEISERYALIGRSPLTDITLQQAEALAAMLGMPVYAGMRNWKPYIHEAVRQMVASGVTQAVAICLAPQNSRTSVGLYRKALEEAMSDAGAKDSLAIEFVDSWHDHPLLIAAFAEKLRNGLGAASAAGATGLPVIFTAHSVPTRTIEAGDPYRSQAQETAELVAKAAGLAAESWRFAFQSQGMSGGAWLGPTVEETILGCKSKGDQGVFIQPIGFVCDHVEVLYDIDIAFTRFAKDIGLRLWRAESLNASPRFISALADLARSRFPQFESVSAGSVKTA